MAIISRKLLNECLLDELFKIFAADFTDNCVLTDLFMVYGSGTMRSGIFPTYC